MTWTGKIITLRQSTNLKKILGRYGMSDCKPAKIPIGPGVANSLTNYESEAEKSTIAVDQSPHRKSAGNYVFLLAGAAISHSYNTPASRRIIHVLNRNGGSLVRIFYWQSWNFGRRPPQSHCRLTTKARSLRKLIRTSFLQDRTGSYACHSLSVQACSEQNKVLPTPGLWDFGRIEFPNGK